MKLKQSLLTILPIIGALLAVGFLSAIWSSITGGGLGGSGGGSGFFSLPNFDTSVGTIQLPFELPIIGGEISELLALLLLTAITFGAVIGMGLPLAFLYRMLDNTTNKLKDEEEFQSSQGELKNAEKAFIKRYKDEQPPVPKPDHTEMGWWTPASAVMSMMLLFGLFGAAFSDSFMGGNRQLFISVLFALAGLLLGALLFNRNRVLSSRDNDRSDVDWGSIWVVLTGAIVVGLGVGIMMWVRSRTG